MKTKSYVLGIPPTPPHPTPHTHTPGGRERSTLPWHVDPHNYAQILALESRGNKTHRLGTVPHFSLSPIIHTDTHSGKEILLAPATHHLSTFIGCLYSPTCCLPSSKPSPNQRRSYHFEALMISEGSQRCLPYYRLLSNLRPTSNVSRRHQFITRNGSR